MVLAGCYLSNPLRVLAALPTDQQNLCNGAGVDCSSSSKATAPLQISVGTITNTLLTVAGAIAVIIIVVGGIRYITSNGDSGAVKQAKDTILYAIIGLIVVIVAYAIVHYVIGNIS
jgi:type IV secretory pathway VirB2 component (pilin)